jgi:hypothetical protein
MTTPDESLEPRTASSGTTRTPPPRTRRGAPAARPSFDEPDALDDFFNPEAVAGLTDPEPVVATATKTRGTRGAKPAPADKGPKPAPGSSKSFDWETAASTSTTSNRDATVIAGAAAEVYGDPVEPEIAFEPTAATRPAKTRAAKRPERRFRQTIQKLDLWSVTKIALCFYISAMGVFVVSLVALWVVADSAGIIDNVENFIGDLFSSENFHFVSGQVLRGAVLVGVVLVALMVAFTIIAASFYNIFAELFGGVEIIIREEEQPPKR